MPRTSAKISQFKSEAAEADWYATAAGRRQTDREFERGIRAGTLVRSTGLKVANTDPGILKHPMTEAEGHATRSVSIRTPVSDLERARSIADEVDFS